MTRPASISDDMVNVAQQLVRHAVWAVLKKGLGVTIASPKAIGIFFELASHLINDHFILRLPKFVFKIDYIVLKTITLYKG